MIRRICILTKSYKNSGYCVAGIDIYTKEWIRLVGDENPYYDEIKKEMLDLASPKIECLDIIEVDLCKPIPNSCQSENWLVNFGVELKKIDTISLSQLNKLLQIDHGEYFISNFNPRLTAEEINKVNRSLFAYILENFKISARFDDYYARYIYKCSFDYNGHHYSNISLTDPIYRDFNKDNEVLEKALIIASLPCLPYSDDLYYKFVAKVFPIDTNLFKNTGFLVIKKEGRSFL